MIHFVTTKNNHVLCSTRKKRNGPRNRHSPPALSLFVHQNDEVRMLLWRPIKTWHDFWNILHSFVERSFSTSLWINWEFDQNWPQTSTGISDFWIIFGLVDGASLCWKEPVASHERQTTYICSQVCYLLRSSSIDCRLEENCSGLQIRMISDKTII